MTMRARGASTLFITAVTAMATLAACGGSSGGNKGHGNTSGTPVQGGTVTLGLGAQGGPNYIFPIMGPQYFNTENSGYFQNLMFARSTGSAWVTSRRSTTS
jgi:hypothetical protein